MDRKIIKHIDLHHPHDSFFQKAMEDPKVARDFIRAHLPKETLAQINLKCLDLQPRVHHKKAGKQIASDIVYRTKIKDKSAYLYFAIEHQSSNDRTMAFRVLKYVIEIMDKAYRETGQYPLVIPLVVYHGKSRSTMKTDLRDLISAPRTLIDTYFLKPFRLIDLTCLEDQELARHQHASLMELALKSTYSATDLYYAQKIIEVYKEYRTKAKNREPSLHLVLEYLFVSSRSVDRPKFVEMVHKELPEDEDKRMINITEELLEVGRNEGREQIKSLTEEMSQFLLEEEVSPVLNF